MSKKLPSQADLKNNCILAGPVFRSAFLSWVFPLTGITNWWLMEGKQPSIILSLSICMVSICMTLFWLQYSHHQSWPDLGSTSICRNVLKSQQQWSARIAWNVKPMGRPPPSNKCLSKNYLFLFFLTQQPTCQCVEAWWDFNLSFLHTSFAL